MSKPMVVRRDGRWLIIGAIFRGHATCLFEHNRGSLSEFMEYLAQMFYAGRVIL